MDNYIYVLIGFFVLIILYVIFAKKQDKIANINEKDLGDYILYNKNIYLIKPDQIFQLDPYDFDSTDNIYIKKSDKSVRVIIIYEIKNYTCDDNIFSSDKTIPSHYFESYLDPIDKEIILIKKGTCFNKGGLVPRFLVLVNNKKQIDVDKLMKNFNKDNFKKLDEILNFIKN